MEAVVEEESVFEHDFDPYKRPQLEYISEEEQERILTKIESEHLRREKHKGPSILLLTHNEMSEQT